METSQTTRLGVCVLGNLHRRMAGLFWYWVTEFLDFLHSLHRIRMDLSDGYKST